jgi:hypothetical protein
VFSKGLKMRILCRSLLVCGAWAAVSSAIAQSPPIKPGLWQLQSAKLVAGNVPVDISAHLKNMPPEARKRMEEVMKQKGIDMGSGDGSMKVCLSRESLDQGSWQGTQFGCKTDFKTRTASAWAWHSVCTNPPSESDGEAIFASPERYTVKSTSKASFQGQPTEAQMTVNAQWVGADCGTLKPMTASTMQAPATPPK